MQTRIHRHRAAAVLLGVTLAAAATEGILFFYDLSSWPAFPLL
jgi:hypothetical protein